MMSILSKKLKQSSSFRRRFHLRERLLNRERMVIGGDLTLRVHPSLGKRGIVVLYDIPEKTYKTSPELPSLGERL